MSSDETTRNNKTKIDTGGFNIATQVAKGNYRRCKYVDINAQGWRVINDW